MNPSADPTEGLCRIHMDPATVPGLATSGHSASSPTRRSTPLRSSPARLGTSSCSRAAYAGRWLGVRTPRRRPSTSTRFSPCSASDCREPELARRLSSADRLKGDAPGRPRVAISHSPSAPGRDAILPEVCARLAGQARYDQRPDVSTSGGDRTRQRSLTETRDVKWDQLPADQR